jgi:hypothetical protein
LSRSVITDRRWSKDGGWIIIALGWITLKP